MVTVFTMLVKRFEQRRISFVSWDRHVCLCASVFLSSCLHFFFLHVCLAASSLTGLLLVLASYKLLLNILSQFQRIIFGSLPVLSDDVPSIPTVSSISHNAVYREFWWRRQVFTDTYWLLPLFVLHRASDVFKWTLCLCRFRMLCRLRGLLWLGYLHRFWYFILVDFDCMQMHVDNSNWSGFSRQCFIKDGLCHAFHCAGAASRWWGVYKYRLNRRKAWSVFHWVS